MKNVKSYKDYCNEEINFKKVIAGAALTGALALGSPASSQITTTKTDSLSNTEMNKTQKEQTLRFMTKNLEIGDNRTNIDIFWSISDLTDGTSYIIESRVIYDNILKRYKELEKRDYRVIKDIKHPSIYNTKEGYNKGTEFIPYITFIITKYDKDLYAVDKFFRSPNKPIGYAHMTGFDKEEKY